MKAFPTPTFSISDEARVTSVGGEGGMLLRDYFAAKAMEAEIIGNEGMVYRDEHLKAIAEISYRMADAMMKARQA